MPRRAKNPLPERERGQHSDLTAEARQTRLISLAMDLVEQRFLDGTASSQEVVHYLRLGTERDHLEREMMEAKNELLQAKTAAIKAAENTERLYAEALSAFKLYSGEGEDEDYYDE